MTPYDDDELLAMHPTYDSVPGWEDDAAREAAYWARMWDLDAIPDPTPDPARCEGCGADLTGEGGPYCHECDG